MSFPIIDISSFFVQFLYAILAFIILYIINLSYLLIRIASVLKARRELQVLIDKYESTKHIDQSKQLYQGILKYCLPTIDSENHPDMKEYIKRLEEREMPKFR